ncbi:MAG: helix-turn-helix domain-containing protein [Candidatus Kariarchaeaceae archaeon]|jgi:predicted DNA binding protein
MVTELRIKVQHTCAFLEFSNTFEDRDMFGYCSTEFDVLFIPGEVSDECLKIASEIFPYFEEWKITPVGNPVKATYLSMKCRCSNLYEDTITSQIQQKGGLPMYPIRYSGGWEYHKIICVDNAYVSGVLEVLQKYPQMKILSIKKLGPAGIFHSQMISITEITNDLTEHQLLILIRAFEEGYYEIPRRIRTQDLASDMGVTRYAVEKSLRAAENKLITSFMPFLLFRKSQTVKIQTN